MHFMLILTPEFLYKIFLCTIIVSIRQLIYNIVIPKSVDADNFAPVTDTEIKIVVLLKIAISVIESFIH